MNPALEPDLPLAKDSEPTLEDSMRVMLARLPEPVRDFLKASKQVAAVSRAKLKYQLHIDQAAVLERELILLLMGIEDSQDFTEALAQEAQIPTEVVRQILTDLNAEVFTPLHMAVRSAPSGGAVQQKPAQMSAPARPNPTQPAGIPVGWTPPPPPAPRMNPPQAAPQARPAAPQAAMPPSPAMPPPSLKSQLSTPQPLERSVAPQPIRPVMPPSPAPQSQPAQAPMPTPASAQPFRPLTHVAPLPPKTTMPGALPRPQNPMAAMPVRPGPPVPRNLPGAPVTPVSPPAPAQDGRTEGSQPRPYPVDPYREPLQ